MVRFKRITRNADSSDGGPWTARRLVFVAFDGPWTARRFVFVAFDGPWTARRLAFVAFECLWQLGGQYS